VASQISPVAVYSDEEEDNSGANGRDRERETGWICGDGWSSSPHPERNILRDRKTALTNNHKFSFLKKGWTLLIR
jgi:hypothetical protein